jgi:hypothetical protein
MTCCERTLVTLAMLTATVNRDSDEYVAGRILSLERDRVCSRCAEAWDQVRLVFRAGTLVRTIQYNLADIYRRALERVEDHSD